MRAGALAATVTLAFALLFGSIVGTRTLQGQEPAAVAGAWRPASELSGQPPIPEQPVRHRVSFEFRDTPLQRALAEVASQAQLVLFVSPHAKPRRSGVTLSLRAVPAVDALVAVLAGTGLEAFVAPDGKAVRVDEEIARVPAMAATGSIAGRVADAKTQVGLVGATVAIEGTKLAATTGADGKYRIGDVPAGTYTVRARYIGYAPGAVSVTVTADQEVTADFALEKSVQRLDEVVTTGTLVPTEVKALPTPISIIGGDDIAAQRPRTVSQIFRQLVPSAVTWDIPDGAATPDFSVRGASNLQGGLGEMKVFVDGVEVADFSSASIDPNSVDRIEVVRGPQAAAIYGSDAVGGVMQVFTKRGDALLTRPRIDGEAAAGIIQTPYADYAAVVRQGYRGSISGGSRDLEYHFGAGYTHTPDWVQPATAQSSASVYGGVRLSRGPLTADVTGRQYIQDVPSTFNPDLTATGFGFVAKPLYQSVDNRAQSLGARLAFTAARWWQHTLSVGVDRSNLYSLRTQPRLIDASDTLLSIANFDETKTSIGYHTSFSGRLANAATGSLTLGFDHYSLPAATWYTSTAHSPSDIGLVSVTRTTTNNTGYFAQAQLAFRDVLFVTGGVRAEQNSNFGDSLATPVSPQGGLTYVRAVGQTTFKLRASWGRAIRPPTPGAKLGSVSTFSVGLANPRLGAERQEGWDAGVDVVVGTRGSLSLSYFDQTAKNLITSVTLAFDPVFTYQNQNVGRVKNSGVEVEGTLSAGALRFRGQYAYARSRIEDLGPNYAGDDVVGDQPTNLPSHTAGATLDLAVRRGTTLAIGATYLGRSRAYDIEALYRCFGGTGPCPTGPGFRAYIRTFPSLLKLNATVSQQITKIVSGFVSADNLTNNTRHEFTAYTPLMGRITSVGLTVRY